MIESRDEEILLASVTSRQAIGSTQPTVQRISGFFQGGKVYGHEFDHSPPLVPTLRVSTPLIFLHTFIARPGTTSPFYFSTRAFHTFNKLLNDTV